MLKGFTKKGLLYVMAVLLACFLHSVAMAQDSSSYTDSSTEAPVIEDSVMNQLSSEEGNREWFDSIKPPVAVIVRKVPDTLVSQLKKDDNYWYVNTAPEREKKKPATKESSKWYQTAWFSTLLWFVVVGSFIAIIIWFLVSSNIPFFRKRKDSIKQIEEMEPGENIFTLDYGRELEKALAANDFRLAIRLWYLSTLKDLSEKELITYNTAKTNSDYVAQLYKTSLYKDFFTLTRIFEYTWYGELPLNRERYAHLQRDFESFKEQLAK